MITRTTDVRGGGPTLRGRVALLVIAVTLPLGALLIWDARPNARADRTLVVAVLLLLAIWGVATFAIRRLLRPLDEIVRAATAVAAGDSLAAVHVGGPREISEIATAFKPSAGPARAGGLRAADERGPLPLRGISGFSQLLYEGYMQSLDATGRNYLERVKAASAKMARLIDDLLNLSRIARQTIHRAHVDVSALAAEVVAELHEADPAREVALTIEPGLNVHADPGLTRIVLANLLDNAWKFTSQTSGAQVYVMPGEIDGRPGFTIRDNGAGFDPASADKLFAPFQRLHGEREFPGTGIGLAIVQRIVHRHDGQVRVVAAPGEGAAFTFTLV